ncbi:hypothetical protein C0585_07650 [Candidatus Woesearchaeota archaeon]|nr:MAG: hypothetical protein C0585_07650 [Candidatus Woesearchaeota archaeon]
MSLKKTILTNTAWLTASRLINSIIGYILIVAIARNLGDVGLGQYSFAFAFASVFFLIVNFGLNVIILKDVARNQKKAEEFIRNIIGIKLSLGLIVLFIISIYAWFFNDNKILQLSLIFAAFIQFISIFSGIFIAYFESNNQMQYGSFASFCERIIALILGVFILFKTKSLPYFILVLLISNLSQFIILTVFIMKRINILPLFNIEKWKKLATKALPYFFIASFTFIIFRIDTIMLSLMVNNEVTGWYNAAYKLIDTLNIIPGLLMVALLPSMSKLFVENKSLLRQLFLRIFRYIFTLILPIVLATTLLADRFIFFIYGRSFVGSTISLQVLIWSELFLFLNLIMGNLLNSIDEQKRFSIIMMIGAIFNIILNLIFIPLYSYKAAAFTTVFTMALNFILMYYYINKNFIKIKFKLYYLKVIISALVMVASLKYILFLPILIIVPIGATIYLLMLLILGLEKEDKILFKEFLVTGKNVFRKRV